MFGALISLRSNDKKYSCVPLAIWQGLQIVILQNSWYIYRTISASELKQYADRLIITGHLTYTADLLILTYTPWSPKNYL